MDCIYPGEFWECNECGVITEFTPQQIEEMDTLVCECGAVLAEAQE